MTTAERLAPVAGEVSPMIATDQAEQFDQYRSNGMNTDVVNGESQQQPETADAEQEDKYRKAAETLCKRAFPSVASVLYTAATNPYVKESILEGLNLLPDDRHVAGLTGKGGSGTLGSEHRERLFSHERLFDRDLPAISAAEDQFMQEFTTIVQEITVKVEETETPRGHALSLLINDVQKGLASILQGVNQYIPPGGVLFNDPKNEEARFPTYTKFNQEMVQCVREQVLNHWIPMMTDLPGDTEHTQAVQEACTKLFEAKARVHEQLASIYGQQGLRPDMSLQDTMAIFSSIVPE